MGNTIGVGRFNRLLQKLMEIKADPPASELAGEIMPVFPVEEFSYEHRFLANTRLAGGGATGAAAAAQLSAVRLRNPASSGALFIVEKAVITLGATGVIGLRRGIGTATDSNLTTLVATRFLRDSRWGSATPVGLVSQTNNYSGVGDNFGVLAGVLANTPLTVELGQVMRHTTILDIFCATVNVQIDVQLWWRERALEASEEI